MRKIAKDKIYEGLLRKRLECRGSVAIQRSYSDGANDLLQLTRSVYPTPECLSPQEAETFREHTLPEGRSLHIRECPFCRSLLGLLGDEGAGTDDRRDSVKQVQKEKEDDCTRRTGERRGRAA